MKRQPKMLHKNLKDIQSYKMKYMHNVVYYKHELQANRESSYLISSKSHLSGHVVL